MIETKVIFANRQKTIWENRKILHRLVYIAGSRLRCLLYLYWWEIFGVNLNYFAREQVIYCENKGYGGKF